MGATGTYGRALALFLHGVGHTVSVVNPAVIKADGASKLSRTKTDQSDATLIARYCLTQRPAAWVPPAPEVRESQALVRRLESLVRMRTVERNRLAAGEVSAAVRRSLERHLAFLEEEVGETGALIRACIRSHPELREQSALLKSVPGIGEATAAALLAEITDVAAYAGARPVAACAGLAPRRHESGSRVRGRGRLSKVGSSRLRRALYFPAVAALRCDAEIRRRAERLRERGKRPKVVICAVMRKLIHIAYGVLKGRCPFDPARTQA